jgi:hypothetical protein
MKKNEILKSFKLALVASFFIIGLSVVSAYDWEAPGCTPPGCDASTEGPSYEALDTSNISQSKSGKLYIEDDTSTLLEEGNLTVDRIYAWNTTYFYDRVVVGVPIFPLFSPDLFVKSTVRLKNLGIENGLENSDIVYEANLCSDEDGNLIACNLTEGIVDNTPFFSASTDITIVKSSIDSDLSSEVTVACPGAYPYIIGGGGYCQDGGFLEGKGIKKSEPADLGLGGAGYDGWKISCNVSGQLIEVYAVCSK